MVAPPPPPPPPIFDKTVRYNIWVEGGDTHIFDKTVRYNIWRKGGDTHIFDKTVRYNIWRKGGDVREGAVREEALQVLPQEEDRRNVEFLRVALV